MSRQPISAQVARRVREAAGTRCGYCHCPQHLVMAPLELHHLTPVAEGRTDDEGNLWLACPVCNGHKSAKVSGTDPETGDAVTLFNPRRQVWSEHFRWAEDKVRIVGLTPTGRATVAALHLSDNHLALDVRSWWVKVGWHPPED